MTFKSFPEVHVADGESEGSFQIETNTGQVMASGTFQDRETAERFCECWNACRKVAFPIAHVTALEDRVVRIEQLRKEAWARVQELEASA